MFVWYLRIRERPNSTSHPFSGVLKVEMLDLDLSIEFPTISTDKVNWVSASLINERNPTTYGGEDRWANHLYPIYLTEKYIKSLNLSRHIIDKIL